MLLVPRSDEINIARGQRSARSASLRGLWASAQVIETLVTACRTRNSGDLPARGGRRRCGGRRPRLRVVSLHRRYRIITKSLLAEYIQNTQSHTFENPGTFEADTVHSINVPPFASKAALAILECTVCPILEGDMCQIPRFPSFLLPPPLPTSAPVLSLRVKT
jgi:hypothetical protein